MRNSQRRISSCSWRWRRYMRSILHLIALEFHRIRWHSAADDNLDLNLCFLFSVGAKQFRCDLANGMQRRCKQITILLHSIQVWFLKCRPNDDANGIRACQKHTHTDSAMTIVQLMSPGTEKQHKIFGRKNDKWNSIFRKASENWSVIVLKMTLLRLAAFRHARERQWKALKWNACVIIQCCHWFCLSWTIHIIQSSISQTTWW